ncbi:hypothetical protein AUP07_0048 [methanogenic archaeon mixed culture ISO4-G1]|nr:hypothetical protein AUP07_0048 [methanogenic archaeon mixed culture ISO4-G1]
MIYTGEMIIGEYFKEEPAYVCPRVKLSREAKSGKYIRLKRDLYVNDPDVPSIALAQAIYGPSYISFDYALSYYGIIPELAYNVSCATFNKRKDKVFKTDICSFYYTDVPQKVFPKGIECRNIDGYAYAIATPEKAICDKLYKVPPMTRISEFEQLLFDDIRFDEMFLEELNINLISDLSESYGCRNVTMLKHYLLDQEVYL